jgi:anti-sigma B factor antagonist
MIYSTNSDEGIVTLSINGELDAISVPELRPALDQLISQGGARRIIVDLTGLRLIDSSGVGAIVYLYRKMRAQGGNVVVRGASDQPLAILRLLKLDQILLDGAQL